MNKIETFSPTQITSVEAHLAWASLEVLADDVNELQVMAAGNDKDVSDLRIQEKEGRLGVEPVSYTHLDVYKRQVRAHPGQREIPGS